MIKGSGDYVAVLFLTLEDFGDMAFCRIVYRGDYDDCYRYASDNALSAEEAAEQVCDYVAVMTYEDFMDIVKDTEG